MQYTTVQQEQEIQQILALQALNHPIALSDTAMQKEGFVTVRHEPNVLRQMNALYPSVIAVDGAQLAGYCLVMLRQFAEAVPVLVPMFNRLESLTWNGKLLRESRWFVMGQVCVALGYRGQGVFDGMYAKLKEHCRADFDFVVTQVAARNARSLRAHERVGFETVEIYPDAAAGEIWHVIAMDL
ncbi:MAG: GNAT family N-acetyltransferase [Lewinellaceae bacterium]|nr:hypothetical protein [Saprospiraceae bacterium]MCB9330641.1 GNAT family N-acetyltransferase [Lewinellaceae bacterium]MCB9334474.1 GNAT family N-acetyltransferase [Lewinellaceae bacterium]